MGGDTPPADTPEWEKFFRENEGLFVGLARKINPDCQRADRHDANQEAYLAGLLAGPAFNASRGTRFRTYACTAARNAVRRYFQRASTAVPTTGDQSKKEASREESPVETEERLRAVNQFITGLVGIDRRLVHLRYYQGLSMQQAADALNISKTAVFKREARILAAGRESLAAWGED